MKRMGVVVLSGWCIGLLAAGHLLWSCARPGEWEKGTASSPLASGARDARPGDKGVGDQGIFFTDDEGDEDVRARTQMLFKYCLSAEPDSHLSDLSRKAWGSPADRLQGRLRHSVAPGLVDPGQAQPVRVQGPLRGAVNPGEELWVIARRPVGASPEGGDDRSPGSGALLARLVEEGAPVKQVAVPLAHTDVKARVSGYISSVQVTQQFHNPYDRTIEAVYVFPLPSNGAVNEFVMVIGKRRIRGLIRDRKEAEKIYRQAKRQGYTASLMTQERPNIFTQKVANIDPGKRIDVTIRYFNTLSYADGAYEFVFPMVVGPRFNPPGKRDGVGAVARGGQGSSGQGTEVQYLRPRERSGQDIALQVDIDAGVALEGLECPTHRIEKAAGEDPSRVRVTLATGDRIPNRDFVLRYRVAGRRMKSGLVTHRDEQGGYFTLMLYPPAGLQELSRAPVEMVFVLDCSGSMSGTPMKQARAAVDHALGKLRPTDTFQLIRFSSQASSLGERPLAATEKNRARARTYLAGLKGSGGTMMIEGIRAALSYPQEENRTRYVVFLTDGYIGNEGEILGEMRRLLGGARVFSFGVGSSVNRYLLRAMAREGRGAVAFLLPQESGQEVMDYFFERISHPALTDIAIDWGGLQVSQVYPKRMPDMFVGRPVILAGRFTGEVGTIKVKGRAGGREVSIECPATPDLAGNHTGLPALWARTLIADLQDSMAGDKEKRAELVGTIRKVARQYRLLSPFTAFVAVDTQTRTKAEQGTTVPVPVPVPAGVRYRTTVR